MKINVHAGHNPAGKIACGAVGIIQESVEDRRVKDEVISQLRTLGHTVYDCTVDNGTSQKDVLQKIVQKCNAHAVDLDVSIHFNSGANDRNGNGKSTGTEVLVYSETSGAKEYAQKICDAISTLKFRNRGVKVNSGLYVLKHTKAPSLLVECCFVDDKDDVELYSYKEMASAIVHGITGKNVSDVVEATKTDAVKETTNKLFRVQIGAYSEKANAEAQAKKLKDMGFDAIIVQA